MKRRTKVLIGSIIGLCILAIAGYLIVMTDPYIPIFLSGYLKAGTWNDSPKNWNRAFGQCTPAGVSVIHSYYWQSNHFTDEHIYFFEVKAPIEWRDAYLQGRKVERVDSFQAMSFRDQNGYEHTPKWFMPDSVDNYDVWDEPGNNGSIWINKTNGHIFFYGIQL
jgi:hypothetical protein